MDPLDSSDVAGCPVKHAVAADSSPQFDSPMPPSFEAASGENVANRGTSYGHPPLRRKNGLKSKAWDHFSRVQNCNPNEPKAKCNYCGKLMNCHSKKQGTSSLLSHLKRCIPYLGRQCQLDKPQVKLSNEMKKDGKVAAGGLTTPKSSNEMKKDGEGAPSDHTIPKSSNEMRKDGEGVVGDLTIPKAREEEIRAAILSMIIVDGLPFKFVEGQGFRAFMKAMEPRFQIPSRITFMRDCVNLYLREKEKLKTMFVTSGQRVCLTTDVWVSVTDVDSVCITAHFIDSDWNLNKKIINFCRVPDFKGVTIGRVIESCILDWGINNIFTITVDNFSSNDNAIDYLRLRTNCRDGTILDNEFLCMRCYARILNLIVSEELKDANKSIIKVRNAVKYVISSPSGFEMFKSCMERQKIQREGLLYLDFPTKWNSTYKMLDVAEKYQCAFELLLEDNEQFVSSLNEDWQGGPGLGPPNNDDWESVRALVKCLKIFYDGTLRISGSLCATSNLYFQELTLVHTCLQEFCESGDYLLSNMAKRLKAKFKKHWGDFENVNLMLFVASTLDPRYKLDALDFWFRETIGVERATNLVAKLRGVLDCLYDQYTRFGEGTCGGVPKGCSTSMDSIEQGALSLLSGKPEYQALRDNMECKSELDQYLMDDVEAPDVEFDILNWWKVNSTKYPILAQIARDVLVIPISTVPSELAFTIEPNVLDPSRSSLFPMVVEALICAQNWLKSPSLDYDDEVEGAEYYDLESGNLIMINLLLYF